MNVRMPTGDIEPIVSDAYTRSSQKLIEQYLIDGTADLQELLKNNGIIIENGPDVYKRQVGTCPRCGGTVYEGKKGFFCDNRDCAFALWKDNKFFSGKKKSITCLLYTSRCV